MSEWDKRGMVGLHALTPESKQRNEPSSKRHQISEGYTSATGQFRVGKSSFIIFSFIIKKDFVLSLNFSFIFF